MAPWYYYILKDLTMVLPCFFVHGTMHGLLDIRHGTFNTYHGTTKAFLTFYHGILNMYHGILDMYYGSTMIFLEVPCKYNVT